jgi:hypothetical protein
MPTERPAPQRRQLGKTHELLPRSVRARSLSAMTKFVTIMRKLDDQDRNDFKMRRIDNCAAVNNVHDYSRTAIKPANYNSAAPIFQSTRDSQER